jgi:uncharacterized repeat protein (TIGR03803 family)
MDRSGTFYGTTYMGGNSVLYQGGGTVFSYSQSAGFQLLYSIAYTSESPYTAPAFPAAGLVLGGDGNFYGSTEYGGANFSGTVFAISPQGAMNYLFSFDDVDYYAGSTYIKTNFTGSNPTYALTVGNDGMLYGTTAVGGTNGYGTVFKMSLDGAFTLLASFDAGGSSSYNSPFTNTFGSQPFDLTQGADGNFYGTALTGGTNGFGTVFKVTPTGVLSCVYTFGQQLVDNPVNGQYYADGVNPAPGLTLGTDGNLYGVTRNGGTNDFGTVFRINVQGNLETLCSLDLNEQYANALVQGPDGNFYGSAYYGGTNIDGGIFQVKIASTSPALAFQQGENQLILSWTNPAFSLQTSPTLNGIFTNVSSNSPFTNLISGPQQFFRLSSH